MKKELHNIIYIVVFILTIVVAMSSCTPKSMEAQTIHISQFNNVDVVKITYAGIDMLKVSYWDLNDTIKKVCYIDKAYLDSVNIGVRK